MSTRKTKLTACAVAALLAGVAGCSSPGKTQAEQSARAAASSLIANPAYQHDKQQLEAELLANFKKDYRPLHPITSVENAVRDTFPAGDTQAIVNYAVQTFTLSDAKNPGRRAWIQGVVLYSLNHGAPAGVGTSTAQPRIPGTTSSP